MIKQGNTVGVHYTGKLTTGEVFDSSEGREPLTFKVGEGQIIPGFENAILGKTQGEKVTTTISPDQAYGQQRQELIIKVPIDKMPGKVEVGQELQAQADGNAPLYVTVLEVNEDHVVVDGNHPLAGRELVFDIEIVSIGE
jgi:peptidylprolyl isomerase